MDSKVLKILLHASPFYGLPFLVPILFYLLVDDLEVKNLALQALVFQVVMGVLIFVSIILIVILIGIPLVVVFGLMGIIVPIIGIIKAAQDEDWNYPIVGAWFR